MKKKATTTIMTTTKKNNMKYDDVKDDLQYTHFLLTIAIKGTELL